jgi:hypothetical protein
MKRLVWFVVIALLIFWVLAQPDSAAGTVQGILGALRDGAESVVRFVTELV